LFFAIYFLSSRTRVSQVQGEEEEELPVDIVESSDARVHGVHVRDTTHSSI